MLASRTGRRRAALLGIGGALGVALIVAARQLRFAIDIDIGSEIGSDGDMDDWA